jgi:hypothetical protein
MDLNKEAQIYSDEEELVLHSATDLSLPLRVDTFYSEKDFDKFIKSVEQLVRRSLEYKHWIAYLIENLGVKECALTQENINETDIEIHHHPINLYTICKSICVQKINTETKFCTFDIATDAIELHFKNKVGYIPLLSDLHKKYHSGFLELPIELVSGDYKYILENYPIDEEERDRIYTLCNIKKDSCSDVGWKKGDYPGLTSS